MATSKQPPLDIAAGVATSLYAKAAFEHNTVQPIYVLHRDTIRTFLHEKIGAMQRSGQLLGLIGIDVSLVAALATTTFRDSFGVPGELIQATFIVCVAICSGYILRWLCLTGWEGGTLGVDQLVDDLGTRGSVIRPSQSESS